MTISMDKRPRVNGLRAGDVVEFSTADDVSVSGTVTKLTFGTYQGDYCDVHVDVDGMNYVFGTGGHLGTSWTTDDGSQVWFARVIKQA